MGTLKKVLIILGLIFLGLILLIALAAFYFYNIHVFKTLRLCVGSDSVDLNFTCDSREDCLDLMRTGDILDSEELEGAPDFAREKIEEVLSKAIYCENSCKINKVRGLDESEDGGFGEIESCFADEEEIKLEIRGKEGLEILKYAKEKGDDF